MTPISNFIWNSLLTPIILCTALFSIGCRDTRTASATIGTAGVALRDNDFKTFRATLEEPARSEWGTQERFQELRRHLPAQTPKILRLDLVKTENCGHNSCRARYYEGDVGLHETNAPEQILLSLDVLCIKVARHRECWITGIYPAQP
jgi:hypothetical protein